MTNIPKNPVVGTVFQICHAGDLFDGATFKVLEHIPGETGFVSCVVTATKPWTQVDAGVNFRWKWGYISPGETLEMLSCPGVANAEAFDDEHAGMIYNAYTGEWVWF